MTLSKHVVLIVWIINVIMINIDNIKQERPNEGPILKLNKRLKWKSKQGIYHKRQGIYGVLDLGKTNSVAFLEVKLFVENHRKRWKIEFFQKVNSKTW